MDEIAPQTLTDALDQAALHRPRTIGARFLDRHGAEHGCHTFDELRQRAMAAAALLRQRGIRPGDRVVIVSPTEVGFYDAFFGCLYAGAVPTPVYPPLRLGKLDEWVARTAAMVQACEARLVIVDRRSRRLFGQVAERVSVELGMVALEKLPAEVGGRGFAPAEVGGRGFAPAEVGGRGSAPAERLALIQFSSGTTRDPAPVMLTHRQILANIDAIVSCLPPAAFGGGGCVSWLPLYHDMGLIGCLLTTLRVAETMTLIGPEQFLARPRLWLEALSRYRGTVSPAPNFAYARCVEKIPHHDLASLDLSGWLVAMNGAEPIAVDAMRAFADRFAPTGFRPEALSPVYGLAEAALAVTFTPFDTPFVARRFDRAQLAAGRAVEVADGIELPSLGRPLPGYELEIRDDDHQAVEDGVVGRLWVRGPSITRGYLGGGDPTRDGWLDTGDRGFLFDGDLFVCGRAKDVVVVRGQNHAAHDLERACDDVPGVRPGCVVAVSELREGGERVHVFVEARERPDGLALRCRESIRRRTGIEPDEVWVLEPGTIPRTSSGKLRRRETLARHLRGELAPPRRVGPLLVARELAKSAYGYLNSDN